MDNDTELPNIPQEIKTLMGRALKPEDFTKWWEKPHNLLGGISPKDAWHSGRSSEVINFIQSALSGDMT
jgi:hypothetical protein